MELTPAVARDFWKSLMDNATNLVTDANLLLEHGSIGRARSLTVLAQEELGKALWLYETFESAWNSGSAEPKIVERLASDGRRHAVKYMAAFVFGQELEAFWGDYGSLYEDAPVDGSQADWDAWFAARDAEAKAAGKAANEEKMLGFYVDLDTDGKILSPTDIDAGTIADDLQTAARVVEMLLIKDHSRMKLDSDTPYDSTHAQQYKLLSISHPEDWEGAPEVFRSGACFQAGEEPPVD
ncbi:AbiV family abortive infection protein [Arthrobacter woluwensis]|uniref:Abortive infection protein, AbiV family n=1 Tax=Arthrobacter woluwensis TaxID=156980 RepID=A0A1H4R7Y5_9MICC|nr:AbiV family abortive infection protein [Arthrobacter woluwensis]SEC28009.1 abortive infection protein, AbiV family [Arthrobacter woluwensis]